MGKRSPVRYSRFELSVIRVGGFADLMLDVGILAAEGAAGQTHGNIVNRDNAGLRRADLRNGVDDADLTHTPRYFFGHGLSYTSFAYSDLRLSAQVVEADGCLQIACIVENTGTLPGDEVVQLYLRDEYAEMTRPVKELAGFCRVALQPGEKKRVSFDVSPSFLAFLDRTCAGRSKGATLKYKSAARPRISA